MRNTSRPWSLAWLLTLGWLISIQTDVQTARAAIKIPEGIQRITSVEGITEYQLANGLRILLFPDRSKSIITVNITYKVGSRHEGYGETGMAHLLEHLVFKGTPKHPDIPKELTERGARPNGTTWFDRTNYYETFDATEDNLRWALGLESDRMINSFISRKDLESEFSVVRNEYERGENNPSGVLYKRMLAAVFQWHNYGHSTIGERSDIEGAPIERLQAFYRQYYQPDNAVLVVAGRIDEEKTLELVQEYFGSIPRPERQIIPTYTKEPVQDGEREITLRRTGDVQVFSVMHRTVAGSHPDYAALNVLEDILTDSPSGRLYKGLVETKKAASVSGRASGFAEGGFLYLGAQVRQEQSLPEAREALLAGLDDIKKNPPTEAEVQRSKARLLKNFELFMRDTEQVGLSLSEYIGMGDWRLAFLYRDQLEKITADDVAHAATFYLKPANRTIGAFIPDAKPDRTDVPEPPVLAELLRDYQGKPVMAEGEDFDASPENIEKRTVRGELSNGLKYAFLTKKTRGESVRGSITLRHGTLETLKGQSIASQFAAALIDRGTTRLSREQIKDAFDRMKARVNYSGGGAALGISIEADREHLAEVIKLAGEVAREASFPEGEFNKMKQEWLAGIEQQKSDPGALAGNLFERISNPAYSRDDPRYNSTFGEMEEDIAKVTLDDVKAFAKNFYGGKYGTAGFAGDFDPAELRQELQAAFGDWASSSTYERIKYDYVEVPVRAETINTPDKANASFVAGYGFPMRDDDPEYQPLSVAGYILGGGFLNSRLATRIRQKDGISYSVRGRFSASPLDQNASFSAGMIYNPQNLARLETAFREELERAAKEGFTADELEAARTGLLKARRVGRASDASLAGTLNSYLFYGRDFTWDARRDEELTKLTLDEVNAVTRKYLDYSKVISVRAGDFQKSERAGLN